MRKGQIAIIAGVCAIAVIGALIFFGIIPGLRSAGEKDILRGELTIWGVDDSQDFGSTLVAGYQSLFPEVTIKYQSFSEANYERQLINALAAGTGPDIFMAHNSWLSKHKDKMSPLSESQYPRLTLLNDFPEVVAKDFNDGQATYAFPLYIDTLSLYVNRDLLNNAGIVSAPTTWEELNKLIPQLTTVSETGRVEQAAVALGTSNQNISHGAELLTLFMLQDRVPMYSAAQNQATFALEAEDSLKRYIGYANPANENYSWNQSQPLDIEAFASEDLAMMFAYLSEEEKIKAKNPFLNLQVYAMPQKAGAQKAANLANYWGLAVANTSQNQSLAWNFIGNTMLSEQTMQSYSQTTSRPPALLTLLGQVASNPTQSFITKQTLTADSWVNPGKQEVDTVFSSMIQSVLSSQSTIQDALAKAQSQISQLY
ncbi:MAG: extracellular solute-binding protein [Candidatus Paceibacterota bacterium]